MKNCETFEHKLTVTHNLINLFLTNFKWIIKKKSILLIITIWYYLTGIMQMYKICVVLYPNHKKNQSGQNPKSWKKLQNQKLISTWTSSSPVLNPDISTLALHDPCSSTASASNSPANWNSTAAVHSGQRPLRLPANLHVLHISVGYETYNG